MKFSLANILAKPSLTNQIVAFLITFINLFSFLILYGDTYMSFDDFKDSWNEKMARINESINEFFSFIGNKLKNFKRLSLGEQIAYCCVGMGLVLILVSIVLFVVM